MRMNPLPHHIKMFIVPEYSAWLAGLILYPRRYLEVTGFGSSSRAVMYPLDEKTVMGKGLTSVQKAIYATVLKKSMFCCCLRNKFYSLTGHQEATCGVDLRVMHGEHEGTKGPFFVRNG